MERANSHHDAPWEAGLERKLDEALAVHVVPAYLSERIVRQTRGQLLRRRSVLARLGGSPLRLAAAVAIVAGLGALFYVTGAASRRSSSQLSVARISAQLDQISNFAQAPDSPVDQQISELQTQLATVQGSDVWGDPQNPTDDALAQPAAVPALHHTAGRANY